MRRPSGGSSPAKGCGRNLQVCCSPPPPTGNERARTNGPEARPAPQHAGVLQQIGFMASVTAWSGTLARWHQTSTMSADAWARGNRRVSLSALLERLPQRPGARRECGEVAPFLPITRPTMRSGISARHFWRSSAARKAPAKAGPIQALCEAFHVEGHNYSRGDAAASRLAHALWRVDLLE